MIHDDAGEDDEDERTVLNAITFENSCSDADLSAAQPSDAEKLKIYWCFFILGLGSLCPWISFIQAADYFSVMYPGIEFYISVWYMVGNLLLFLLCVPLGPLLSPRARAVSAYALDLLLMVSTPFLPLFLSDSAAFLAICAFSALLGAAEAVLGSTMLGMAGMLWPHTVNAWVNGQGATGLLIAVARIATKLAYSDTPEGLRVSSEIYFSIAAAGLAGCLGLWWYFEKIPAIQRVIPMQSYETILPDQERSAPETHRRIARQPQSDDESPADAVESAHPRDPAPLLQGDDPYKGPSGDDPHLSIEPGAARFGLSREEGARILRLLWQVRWPGLLVCMVFTVTLAIIPGLIVEIRSQQQLGSWLPVILIAIFNLFDWLGRALPYWSFATDWASLTGVSWAVASRLLFIPLFVLAAINALPPLSLVDFSAMVLTGLLALSNGYLITVVLMKALEWAQVASQDAQMAMTLVAFCLVLGLTIGACIGLIFSTLFH